MAYRLEKGESAARAARRIGAELLDAVDRAARGEDPGDPGERVHTARTSLKRARALLRLLRPAIGEAVFRRENEALRDAGRILSGARDAAVLVQALDRLIESDGVGEDREGPAADLRAALVARREAEVVRGWDAEALGRRIGEVRGRIDEWSLREEGWILIDPGLTKLHRTARRRLSEARDARGEQADRALHELRKRVKDLTYVAELLGPVRPEQLAAREASLKKLGDRLGDHHDLTVLRAAAVELLPAGGGRLVDRIDERRASLARKALRRAEELLEERPRRVAARLARDLEAWERS